MSYNSFASVYDELTKNVDYKGRAEYICKILKKYNITDGYKAYVYDMEKEVEDLLKDGKVEVIGEVPIKTEPEELEKILQESQKNKFGK